MHPAPALRFTTDFTAPDSLTICPWPDEVIDSFGFDPRSAYVEQYWLGILGPSTTWLLRRLASGLELHPDGYPISLADTARALGLRARGGRSSPFVRAVNRTIKFELAVAEGPEVLAVRRKVPPLTQRQVEHLPPALQTAHRRWQDDQLRVPTGDLLRRRGRLLALSMIELGDDLESAEHRLLKMRYHPALAHDAAGWAWERHRAALASAG
ncbi:MAG: hypothetical protein M3083_03935 [Actinomycetota bacterium]|nr:hypothetical protein [Actinomycetota bacterium]MDQ6946012.1 hypothetical protein [Actinomycetota bacterium]